MIIGPLTTHYHRTLYQLILENSLLWQYMSRMGRVGNNKTVMGTIIQFSFYVIFLLGRNAPQVVQSFSRSNCCFASRISSSAASATSLNGVRSTARRVRDSVLSRDRTDKDLKDGIAFFYDRSSKLWEDVWGEQ